MAGLLGVTGWLFVSYESLEAMLRITGIIALVAIAVGIASLVSHKQNRKRNREIKIMSAMIILLSVIALLIAMVIYAGQSSDNTGANMA